MSVPFSLADRVVVITGASGGIGSAIAAALTQPGTQPGAPQAARLILCGRNESMLQALAADLPAQSVEAIVTGSLTAPACRNELARCAAAKNASVLVNAMGINLPGLFDRQSDPDIGQLIDTNLCAPMLVTRELLPGLLRQPSALVVNIGSVFGTIGHPGYTAYCATKFGLRGFSEALMRELADTSVHVLHVEPRATRTAMNNGPGEELNRRLGNTEDTPRQVAAAVIDAMGNLRVRTTIGWPERFFAAVNRMAPAIVDRALRSKLGLIKTSLNEYPS